MFNNYPNYSEFVAGLQEASHALRLSLQTVVHSGSQLKLVPRGLLLPPGGFTLALLLCQAAVLLLQGLELSVLARGHVVLKHSTHASDGVGLHGVVLFLLSLGLVCGALLVGLLAGPLPLLLGLECHSLVVEQVLALELGAARGKGRHVLLRAVESLASSLHLCF